MSLQPIASLVDPGSDQLSHRRNLETLIQKGPTTMAIDIHYVTSENAHEAFLNRVIDRFCQINPTIEPARMEPYIGYLFDYTIADLDILASILIVDVEWLLTGHGWCPPVSHKYRH